MTVFSRMTICTVVGQAISYLYTIYTSQVVGFDKKKVGKLIVIGNPYR